MAPTTFTFQIIMLHTKIISFIVIFLGSFLVFGVLGICFARLESLTGGGGWINLSPTPSQVIKFCLIVGFIHGLAVAIVSTLRGFETVLNLFLSTAIAVAIIGAIGAVLVVVGIIDDPSKVNWSVSIIKGALFNFSGYFFIFDLILLIPSIFILLVNIISLKYIAKINLNPW